MTDARIQRLAEVLVDYSLRVEPGELTVISGGVLAAPLLREVYRLTLARGAYPLVDLQLPGLQEILLKEGSDDQLAFLSPLERVAHEQATAFLRVGAAENTRALSGIAPARQQAFQKARAGLRQSLLDRAARGELKWTSTIYPTPAYAQEADMSLSDYEDFVFRAEFLDDPDPVARWRALHDRQQRMIDWLSTRREVHILGPDTDLRLSIAGRTWINSDGRRNFPSGEVFTGPVEDSATGSIRFSYPTIVQGREVEDVRLWFERGRVVRATAARNEEFLQAMLATDEGARYLGEFAFGTNPAIIRFTRMILFDEKIGGTVHLALGSGYPDTGSRNRSAIHWDLICDLRQGGEVRVDGEVFLKDGRYTIAEE